MPMRPLTSRILGLVTAILLGLPPVASAQAPAATTRGLELAPAPAPLRPAPGHEVAPVPGGAALRPPATGPHPESLRRGHDPIFLGRPTRSTAGTVWLGPSAWIAAGAPVDAAIGPGGPALGFTIAWPATATAPTVGSAPVLPGPGAER